MDGWNIWNKGILSLPQLQYIYIGTDIERVCYFPEILAFLRSWQRCIYIVYYACPDCTVHGANMGRTWGRQDPGWPRVGPMNLAIWVVVSPPFVTLPLVYLDFNGFIAVWLTYINRHMVLVDVMI